MDVKVVAVLAAVIDEELFAVVDVVREAGAANIRSSKFFVTLLYPSSKLKNKV